MMVPWLDGERTVSYGRFSSLHAWHCDTRSLMRYARNVTQHLLDDLHHNFAKDGPLAMNAKALVATSYVASTPVST